MKGKPTKLFAHEVATATFLFVVETYIALGTTVSYVSRRMNKIAQIAVYVAYRG